MGQERRKSPRFRASLEVTLTDRRPPETVVTHDISRSGMFVVTDRLRDERQMVRIEVEVPPYEQLGTGSHTTMILPVAGSRFLVTAMVSRLVTAEEAAERGTVPGMGLNFFALGGEERRTWEQLVAYVASLPGRAEPAQPRPPSRPPPPPKDAGVSGRRPTPPPLPVERARRQFPRHSATFLVRKRSQESLETFFTRDISAGGMFLKTPVTRPVDDVVRLVVVHPASQEEFPLFGRVVRSVADGPLTGRGMGIEFIGLEEGRRKELGRFIETGHAPDADEPFP